MRSRVVLGYVMQGVPLGFRCSGLQDDSGIENMLLGEKNLLSPCQMGQNPVCEGSNVLNNDNNFLVGANHNWSGRAFKEAASGWDRTPLFGWVIVSVTICGIIKYL